MATCEDIQSEWHDEATESIKESDPSRILRRTFKIGSDVKIQYSCKNPLNHAESGPHLNYSTISWPQVNACRLVKAQAKAILAEMKKRRAA